MGGPAVKFVVKLGGAALEDTQLTQLVGKAIHELVQDGHQVAVVHGGRRAAHQDSGADGQGLEFVSGLRVTDAETRDAALMVLAGRVNKGLVAALGQQGQSAVGLSGGDGHVFRARKKKTNPTLASSARLPTPTPSGSKPSGRWARCLSSAPSHWALTASTTTSTPMRWPPPAPSPSRPTRLSSLPTFPASKGRTARSCAGSRLAQIPAMEQSTVVSGGMLPKLNACKTALTHGVKRVRILPAGAAASLPDLISSRINEGTEVMVA